MTSPEDSPVYLVTGEDGEPLGVFDPARITDEGHALAFRLAAVCGDTDAMLAVQEDALARVGPDAYGYVAAHALAVTAEHILAPAVQLAHAHGHRLRETLTAIADRTGPGTSPRTGHDPR